MVKALALSFLLVVSCVSSWAQELKPVDEVQKEAMIRKITQATASLKTIQCDFEQTKHLSFLKEEMVSKGKMYYKQDRMLRWEYNIPYDYIFILNGTKVMLKSSGRKDVIDVKSSRLFQEVAGIMLNSVTGKCLDDNKDFRVTMYMKGREWIAKLIPLKKEMKQMFRTITLYFNQDISMISKVEMEEKSGDVTLIVLKNVHANTTIDEKVFVLD
jgi:outer membrane lipoprotein carrier protein